MKTLDEVIAYFDNQTQQRHVYLTEDAEDIYNDVLHYLKEYRETKKHLACLDDAEIRGDDTQVVNNPPLTWDELREMEGKPVWVEMDGYKPNWGIVMNQDKRNGRLMLCGYDEVEIRMEINEEGEGTGWQAYRKERK